MYCYYKIGSIKLQLFCRTSLKFVFKLYWVVYLLLYSPFVIFLPPCFPPSRCSRLYWSTVDPRRRCKYTCNVTEVYSPLPEKPGEPHWWEQEENRTIAHSFNKGQQTHLTCLLSGSRVGTSMDNLDVPYVIFIYSFQLKCSNICYSKGTIY